MKILARELGATVNEENIFTERYPALIRCGIVRSLPKFVT